MITVRIRFRAHGGTSGPWRDPKRKAWLWALFVPTCGVIILPTVWLLGFLGP